MYDLSTSYTVSNASNSSTPSTKIILVRHGRSTFNEQGRYQGSSNESVLTEKGKKAAFLTGLALKNYQFDAIYSSPLTRVKQTTDEITKALSSFYPNLPNVIYDRRLKEVNMADWEGLSYSYVKENLTQDYTCWQQTPHLFSFAPENNSQPDLYPLQDLYARVKSCLNEIINQHQGKTVLIVAHGGTNRALISTVIGLHPSKYHSLQQSNCGISCLELPATNSYLGQLNYLNITNHLGEYLPKLKAGKTGWRWLLLSNTITEDLLNSSCLQELAKQNFIDLILTDNSQSSECLALKLLQNGNKVLYLQTAQDNFIENWQQTILTQQRLHNHADNSSLVTILVIAPKKIFAQIISKNLDIKTSVKIQNCLSVIHFPHTNRQSILQGLFPIDRQLVTQSY